MNGSEIMTKTVLVTGAQGFLGSYIARYFASKNRRVVGTHRRSVDSATAGEMGLTDSKELELPSSEFDRVLDSARPSLLVHCAGPSSVADSVTDPYSDFRHSVDVLFCVLDSVRRLVPACKVVFVSSAAVYGNPQHLPVSENSTPAPISPYGFHKLLCETLISEFTSVYGLRACTLRVFSAYGPGLRRQVLWDICRRALEDGSIRLHGTGHETRDFIHAEDVARAIELVDERADCAGEVYNLAGGIATRIDDLSTMLIDALGVNTKIEFTAVVRPGDPLFWQADMSRLSRLGFRPSISLSKGTVDFARWVLSLGNPR